MQLTWKVYKENSVKIGILKEEKFSITDHLLDNQIEPVIIYFSENDYIQ